MSNDGVKIIRTISGGSNSQCRECQVFLTVSHSYAEGESCLWSLNVQAANPESCKSGCIRECEHLGLTCLSLITQMNV